jgi:hypothetical protein
MPKRDKPSTDTLTVPGVLPGDDPEDAAHYGLKMLLHGEAGVGKTWLLSSFSHDPRTSPMLIIDPAHGTKGIRGRGMLGPGSKVREVDSDVKIMELLRFVGDNPGSFRCVAIDDFVDVMNVIRLAVAREMGTTPDKITDKQNAQFSVSCYEKARRIWRQNKKLARLGVAIIVTTWTKKTLNPRTGMEQFAPQLPGAFAYETTGYFDIVAAMSGGFSKDGSKTIFTNEFTTRKPGYVVKDRFDCLRTIKMPTATKILDRLSSKSVPAAADDEPEAAAEEVQQPADPATVTEPEALVDTDTDTDN